MLAWAWALQEEQEAAESRSILGRGTFLRTPSLDAYGLGAGSKAPRPQPCPGPLTVRKGVTFQLHWEGE